MGEVNLSHTTITSPIDGIVVSRDVNVGQTVAASLSAPTLFTIANDLTQMQVIANIDQADIGLVEQAKSVKFSVDAFPGKDYDGKIEQMRLNPQTVQNVVTYNVVIDVNNPEQKLKPGMTANLVITIDERNNVLKVPNAALRFTPADAAAQLGNRSGQRTPGAAASSDNANAGANAAPAASPKANNSPTNSGNNSGNTATPANPARANGANGQQGGGRNFGGATAPIMEGQTRVVWGMGQDGKPQARRIKVGLTDGGATEFVEGNLVEGELVITGQTVTAASKPASSNTAAPGFRGAPLTGGGAGGRCPQ